MDSAEEDEEMCPEQIEQIEQIIPSTWQVPFFCQRQLSLPEAASAEIATSSFASLASTYRACSEDTTNSSSITQIMSRCSSFMWACPRK